ncbi:hypothetical protein GVAV_000268 [Gurleya vavrai]
MSIYNIPSPQSNGPVDLKKPRKKARKKLWVLKQRKGIIRENIYEYDDPSVLTPRQQILWYQKHTQQNKDNNMEIKEQKRNKKKVEDLSNVDKDNFIKENKIECESLKNSFKLKTGAKKEKNKNSYKIEDELEKSKKEKTLSYYNKKIKIETKEIFLNKEIKNKPSKKNILIEKSNEEKNVEIKDNIINNNLYQEHIFENQIDNIDKNNCMIDNESNIAKPNDKKVSLSKIINLVDNLSRKNVLDIYQIVLKQKKLLIDDNEILRCIYKLLNMLKLQHKCKFRNIIQMESCKYKKLSGFKMNEKFDFDLLTFLFNLKCCDTQNFK